MMMEGKNFHILPRLWLNNNHLSELFDIVLYTQNNLIKHTYENEIRKNKRRELEGTNGTDQRK
jgi:hypothetical protein